MAKLERRKQFLKSFEAKSLRSRSFLTRVADDLTAICGSTPFLVLHVIFFAGWILANTGHIPGVAPFDPYPFGFLTMVVSLEAIFLAIFVLVSQNRSSYVNSIRNEVQLRVNLITEEEVTKILQLLVEMKKEMGNKKVDAEVEKMIERTDTSYIEQSIVDQLQRANKPWVKQLVKEFPDLFLDTIKKPIDVVTDTMHITSNEKETPATKSA